MAERSWTVLELLRWTTAHFEACGIESSRLDAECLLAFALGSSRLGLYVEYEKLVNPEDRARFRELVRRRGSDRVPVSQLVGSKEFWSLPFRVSADVLTPRPETETLVSAALERMPDAEGEYRVLDLGTGSGAVALSISHERRESRVTGTDISTAALQIAADNADQLQLGDRVHFLEGSLFDPVRGELFDMVVSNPPYVARSDSASLPPELAFEPEVALFGGDDGLAILDPLIRGVGEVLVAGGSVAVEIDPRQAEAVAALCAEAGLGEIELLRDLSRRTRVVTARKAEA